MAEYPDGTLPPPATLIQEDEKRMLIGVLANLPYQQREVITLHLHADLTFREIAKRLNISNNTARSRYRYGLEKLRKSLDPKT